MNGTAYHFEGRRLAFLRIFILPGLGLLIAAMVQGEPIFYGYATTCIALTLFSWTGIIRSRQIEVSDAIVDLDSGERFEFAHIEGVWTNGQSVFHPLVRSLKKRGPRIVIKTPYRTLVLYSKNETVVDNFLSHLQKLIGHHKPQILSPYLGEYFQQQVATFGFDKVWFVRELPFKALPSALRNRIGIQAFLIFGPAIIPLSFVAYYAPKDSEFVIAILLLAAAVISTVLSLLFAVSNTRRSGSRGSGLVISPAGFAMKQRHLEGEMSWDEINSIQLYRHGIRVQVPGATMDIFKSYEVDASTLHQHFSWYRQV